MRICKLEDCGGKHHGQGWCVKHYTRVRKHGDPSITATRTECSVDGCEGKHFGKGYCKTHHTRFLRHGDPSIVLVEMNQAVPSYDTLHQRLRYNYGAAKLHDCAVCFEPADEWALIKELVPEGEMFYQVNQHGYVVPYSVDEAHYLTLCRKHHRQLDAGQDITYEDLLQNEGVGSRAGKEMLMS